jgi:hypothetical protein
MSVSPKKHPFAFLTSKEYLEQLSDYGSPRTSIYVAEESSGEDNCRIISFVNCTSYLILFSCQIKVVVMDEACSMRSEGKRHVFESWPQCLRGLSTTGIGWNENIKAPLIIGV